ncbi:hypothetical protein Lalb_Chr05g0217991 [Lupinus albus]|uniref:Uncharacterized protein n=1 Tax=Lupinus albus TaxID=3870 RepID=A0A6A4QHU5_LUPAL|nr:hypothetical protein Lalb_Chr05g0217991 [Lupinus albus]
MGLEFEMEKKLVVLEEEDLDELLRDINDSLPKHDSWIWIHDKRGQHTIRNSNQPYIRWKLVALLFSSTKKTLEL